MLDHGDRQSHPRGCWRGVLIGWLGGASGNSSRRRAARRSHSVADPARWLRLSRRLGCHGHDHGHRPASRGHDMSAPTRYCAAPRGYTQSSARPADGKRNWQIEGSGGGGVTGLVSSWPRYRVLGRSHWTDWLSRLLGGTRQRSRVQSSIATQDTCLRCIFPGDEKRPSRWIMAQDELKPPGFPVAHLLAVVDLCRLRK